MLCSNFLPQHSLRNLPKFMFSYLLCSSCFPELPCYACYILFVNDIHSIKLSPQFNYMEMMCLHILYKSEEDHIANLALAMYNNILQIWANVIQSHQM